MRKDEMTTTDLLLEAVGIVAAFVYLGLQIYYGIIYGAELISILMNGVMLILVYVGLTLLCFYPEKVNGLTKEACTGKVREACTGKVRIYTIHMVRAVKLIFVISLLFTSICDVMGVQLNGGYSLVAVVLIVAVTVFYEVKIIRLLRKR